MINHLWSPQISKTNDLHNKKTQSGFPPSTPFFSQNPQVDNRKKKTSNYKKLGGHESKLFHNLLKPSNLSKIGSDHFLGPTKLTGSRLGPKNHRQQNIPLGKSSTPTYRTPVGICKIVPFGGGHLIVLIVLWWNLQVLWWWYIWTYHFSLKHQRLPLENLVFKFWVKALQVLYDLCHFPPLPKKGKLGCPSEFVHDCCSSCCCFIFDLSGLHRCQHRTLPTSLDLSTARQRTLSSISRNFREAWSVDILWIMM